MQKLGNAPNTDWLKLYEEKFDFGDSPEKRLRIEYFLNALIVQKLEKEKGFSSVMELLSCGPYEKGHEKYFKALEKTTGINRSTFNQEIEKLVQQLRK